MTQFQVCPRCGAEMPHDAPQGLCPACVLQQGFAGEVGPSRGIDPAATSAYTRFTPPQPAELAPLFPQLEIIELLGQGGMGAVYKARQPGLDRLVALKILPRESSADPAFAERFTREARALARLSHPNIVGVFDFGQAGGLYYFLMDYVDGLNLRRTIEAGTLDPAAALAIVPQICQALQYAHDQGVVHRDIKPENILLDTRGRVKIADFGLAKLLGRGADFTLTGTQQVMGTPHYMAPEQIEHPQQVDHRADIYSLGVVFYEMLTGELPLGRFAPPSSRVHVDVRLDEIVLRSLEKEPDRRYQHASEVQMDVQRISQSGVGVAQAATGKVVPPMATATLRPGGAAQLLMLAIMLVFSALVMTVGVALAIVAFLTQNPNSQEFWGWMGGAFGCFFGGGGGLIGTWNSYRQLEGSRDLMHEPNWIWIDWISVGYGALGIALLIASVVAHQQLAATPDANGLRNPVSYSLALLGAIVTFQAVLFLVIRGLARRTARLSQTGIASQ